MGACLQRLEAQTEPPAEILCSRGDGVATESEDIAALFRASRGRRIATTNADCYLPLDFIERMNGWLDSGFDMASGVRVPSFFRLPSRPHFSMSTGAGVTGSGLMFDRSLLGAAMPFRFPVGWDVELALRSKAKVVIDPSVRVVHDDRYSPSRLARKALKYVARNGAMTLMFGGLRSVCIVPAGWRKA